MFSYDQKIELWTSSTLSSLQSVGFDQSPVPETSFLIRGYESITIRRISEEVCASIQSRRKLNPLDAGCFF